MSLIFLKIQFFYNFVNYNTRINRNDKVVYKQLITYIKLDSKID